MAKQSDLNAYDDRYRLIYEAGGETWNDTKPNRYLASVLEKLPQRSNCIEFGCGEGFQCRFIASKGHDVVGIDLSSAAIERAMELTTVELPIRFCVGDITDLRTLELEEGNFDLAVDISCLHMMADEEDRKAYLNGVWTLLRKNAYYLIIEGIAFEDIHPKTEEEREYVNGMREVNQLPSGHMLARTIQTRRGPKEIQLPLCPKGKVRSIEGYTEELSSAGFRIVSTEVHGGMNEAYEAVVLSEKVNA
jgi:SAM-dependent methyltransferase